VTTNAEDCAPKTPLRWRRRPRPAGAWRALESHELRRGEECLVTVQRIEARASNPAGWFWYGEGRNTAAFPLPLLAEAKREAEAHARKTLGLAPKKEGRR
jgi:hypothetical protein